MTSSADLQTAMRFKRQVERDQYSQRAGRAATMTSSADLKTAKRFKRQVEIVIHSEQVELPQ